jgi:hypothetical protein
MSTPHSATHSRTPSPTAAGNTRVGDFWIISSWQNGQTITGTMDRPAATLLPRSLNRAHRTAVIVLSDVSNPVDDLGISLLAQHQ